MPPARRKGMAVTSFYNESDSDSDCGRGFYDRSKKKKPKKDFETKPNSPIPSVTSDVTENGIPGPPAAHVATMQNVLTILNLPSGFFTSMSGMSILQCKLQIAYAVSNIAKGQKALSAAEKQVAQNRIVLTRWTMTMLAVGLCIGSATAVLILCPWDEFFKAWWRVMTASWSCCNWSHAVPDSS